MRVLIVGGTGLISTGITRQLVEADHEVVLYNRGETDARVPDAVESIRGDRTEFDRFERQMAEAGSFDAVIDMVCYTPEEAHSAVRAFDGVTDHYVFCSTIDVYRRPVENMPVTEDAARYPPTSDYGEGKARAEDVFTSAHDEDGFPVTIIRPWHTYGEGGTILHSLGYDTRYVDRIRRGLPIVVHGDGTSVWAPCHRDDVARAFVNAVGDESTVGEAYHVTSEQNMTFNQYHRRVAEALDAPEPELVHIPTDVLTAVAPDRTDSLVKHFQYSTVFDNSKAKADLDYEYTIPWKEGVRRTVSWLDERDRIEDADEDPFYDRIVDAWREHNREVVAELTD
jgi:nucleoside-diphosphate-sugar epimerase